MWGDVGDTRLGEKEAAGTDTPCSAVPKQKPRAVCLSQTINESVALQDSAVTSQGRPPSPSVHGEAEIWVRP